MPQIALDQKNAFLDKVFLSSRGYSGTLYVDHASLKFTEIHLPLPPEI